MSIGAYHVEKGLLHTSTYYISSLTAPYLPAFADFREDRVRIPFTFDVVRLHLQHLWYSTLSSLISKHDSYSFSLVRINLLLIHYKENSAHGLMVQLFHGPWLSFICQRGPSSLQLSTHRRRVFNPALRQH